LGDGAGESEHGPAGDADPALAHSEEGLAGFFEGAGSGEEEEDAGDDEPGADGGGGEDDDGAAEDEGKEAAGASGGEDGPGIQGCCMPAVRCMAATRAPSMPSRKMPLRTRKARATAPQMPPNRAVRTMGMVSPWLIQAAKAAATAPARRNPVRMMMRRRVR